MPIMAHNIHTLRQQNLGVTVYHNKYQSEKQCKRDKNLMRSLFSKNNTVLSKCQVSSQYIMSEQQKSGGQIAAGASQQRPKRARRSRKDCDERSFICKHCQKSYLSNAALYTHVKNKHQPQKLKQLTEQKGTEQERKRDHKNEGESSPPQIAVGEQIQYKQDHIDSNSNSNALEGLRHIMKKYYPERNKNSSIKLICQGLAPEIVQYIQPLLKQAQESRFNDVSKSKLTISQVFSIFLSILNSKVSSSCINFLIRFFFYFRHALRQQSKKPDFCERQNASNVPNYFNNVILNRRIPISGYEEQELMHNQLMICSILEHFGCWLYDEMYTDFQTTPNYEPQS